METGPKISIAAHGAIILGVAFGGPIFDADDSAAIQISEVSIVSGAEFASLQSQAPRVTEPAAAAPAAPAAPDGPEVPAIPSPDTALAAPAAPDAPSPPELPADAAVPEPIPQPVIEAPTQADTAQAALGGAVTVPNIPEGQVDNPVAEPEQLALVRPRPRPARRIDSTPAPPPPEDLPTGDTQVDATAPDESATPQPDPPARPAAPEASTTEIVTDDDATSAAPKISMRPRGRPSDITRRAQAAREATAAAEAAAAAAAAETDESATEDTRAAQAAAIAAALAEVDAGAAPSAAAVGPPLTGSEKAGLVLAVRECWNVPVGVQDAGNLRVVLAVNMNPDGSLNGAPRLIEPGGTPQGLTRQAFEAGRRALLRCAPYDLPRDKYEHWKRIEVAFDPRNMVLR